MTLRILGVDPGLRTTGFGCGTPLRGFTSAGADASLRRSPRAFATPWCCA
ncbi:MAG: hypothetical protein ACLGIT_17380 [Gammaproteobacteria bacterium]